MTTKHSILYTLRQTAGFGIIGATTVGLLDVVVGSTIGAYTFEHPRIVGLILGATLAIVLRIAASRR